MTIEVLNWGLSLSSKAPDLAQALAPPKPLKVAADAVRRIWCNVTDTWRDAAVFSRANLVPGDSFDGPALIIEPQTTTYVSADFHAEIDGRGNIWMTSLQEDAP